MRLSSPTLAACLPLVAAAIGCSANVAPSAEAADAEATTATGAVIVVERTSGAADRGEAVARFARVRGRTGEEALRAALDLEVPAAGSCVTVQRAQEQAPMQLLDVGAVTVEANGVTTSLQPRRLPNVVEVVSGVVYTRSADGETLPARAPYVLKVAGAGELEPFTVSAGAPADPTDVRIALAAAGVIDLTWEAGSADDVVYVDVAGKLTPTLRCAFSDAGRAQIPAAGIDEGTIAVHRLHRERFKARGVDAGEMRFDFARVVTFSRR